MQVFSNKTPIRAYPWDAQTVAQIVQLQRTSTPVKLGKMERNSQKDNLKLFLVKTLIINVTKFASANNEAILRVIRILDI